MTASTVAQAAAPAQTSAPSSSSPVSPSSLVPHPPIDLSQPRYPQSTYSGRIRQFIDVIDPRTLFASNSQLRESHRVVQSYNKNGWSSLPPSMSVSDLYGHKKLVDSAVHPDTHQIIFLPFRFAAFVPTNIPLVMGMLSAQSPMSTVFWQFCNQSYNVAVNYSNRNATQNMEMSAIATSYVGAVLVSCGIAVGLGKLNVHFAAKSSINPIYRSVFSWVIPFVAVASAGAFNVFLMRRNEMVDGIQVQDEYGCNMGVSKIAGSQALREVMLTRVALPAPILLFPPLIMKAVEATGLTKWKPFLRTPLNIAGTTLCLLVALPCAIGLFPQQSKRSVDSMEEHFKGKVDSKGNKLKYVYFNKGL